jgi:hypothetical protein
LSYSASPHFLDCWERVSLYCPGWPGTCGLRTSGFWGLGLQMFTNTPDLLHFCHLIFFIKFLVPTSRHWWLMPVILATQEAEIRRIMVWSQPRTNSSRDDFKKTHHVKGWLYDSRWRPWVQTLVLQNKKKKEISSTYRMKYILRLGFQSQLYQAESLGSYLLSLCFSFLVWKLKDYTF